MNQITFNLIVGSILRSVIVAAAGWLTAHGMLPTGTVTDWVEAVLLVLLGVGWSLYEKYTARVALLTALTLRPGATENDLKAKVALGVTPSILTPPDTTPGVPLDKRS